MLWLSGAVLSSSPWDWREETARSDPRYCTSCVTLHDQKFTVFVANCQGVNQLSVKVGHRPCSCRPCRYTQTQEKEKSYIHIHVHCMFTLKITYSAHNHPFPPFHHLNKAIVSVSSAHTTVVDLDQKVLYLGKSGELVQSVCTNVT